MGIYSASSTKTLDTYGGGLLVTDNLEISNAMAAYASSLKPVSRLHLFGKILVNTLRNLATSKYIFSFLTYWALRMLDKIEPNSSAYIFRSRRVKSVKDYLKVVFWLYISPSTSWDKTNFKSGFFGRATSEKCTLSS